MAQSPSDPNSGKDQDNQYNPGQQDYEQKFQGRVGGFKGSYDAQRENSSIDQIRNSESSGITENAKKAAADGATKAGAEAANLATGSRWAGRAIKFTSNKFRQSKPETKLFSTVIAGLFLIGIASLFLIPNLALINFVENIREKLDSQTAAVAERADQAFIAKLYDRGPNLTAGCKIKVKCKFSGISEKQYQKLIAQEGASLEGVKKTKVGPITRYTADALVVKGERYTASNYKRGLRSSGDLRNVIHAAYKPIHISFADSVSKKLSERYKLARNPKVVGANEAETRQLANKTINPDGTTGSTSRTSGAGLTDEEINNAPEGSDRYGVDDITADSDINNEVESIKEKVANGDPIRNAPNSVASIAVMDPYVGGFTAGGVARSVIGVANPLDFFSTICFAYQLAKITVFTALAVQVTGTMRFAAEFAAVADKAKAGDLTDKEMDVIMKRLNVPNEYGDIFDDTASNVIATQDRISESKPTLYSAFAGEGVQTLSTAIQTFEKPLGQEFTSTGCKVLTNVFVTSALALTIFIPGAGVVTAGVKNAIQEGLSAAVKTAIQRRVDNITAAFAERGVTRTLSTSAKNSAQRAGNGIKTLARNPLFSIGVAMFIYERYGVAKLSQMLAGTDLNYDTDGATSADAIYTGLELTDNKTAIEAGIGPISKTDYLAYNSLSQEHIALNSQDLYERAKIEDTYNLNNYYSPAGQFAANISPMTNGLNNGTVVDRVTHMASYVISLPSMLIPGASAQERFTPEEYIGQCNDAFYEDKNLAVSPFCVVKSGFGDINMLRSVGVNETIDYMLDGEFIDDLGRPIAGSEFETFIDRCTNADSVVYENVGGADDSTMPEDCYINESEQQKMFRLYMIDDRVYHAFDEKWGEDEYGLEEVKPQITQVGSTPGSGAAATGTAAELAQKILNTPRVQFVGGARFGDAAKAAIEAAARGEESLTNCEKRPITSTFLSPELLGAILTASEKYVIGIGSLTNTCHSPTSLHYKGQAVDVNKLNGLEADGKTALDREFVEYFVSLLPAGSAQVGQTDCMPVLNVPAGTQRAVGDPCNHIHIGVRVGITPT